jgi:hypothetical protein
MWESDEVDGSGHAEKNLQCLQAVLDSVDHEDNRGNFELG